MIPHSPTVSGTRLETRFYVVEKPGLDIAELGGFEEEEEGREEEREQDEGAAA
jgi:hypothetical protein